MYDDLISTLESRYGLLPGELAAVWEQESQRSTDPKLQGRTPTRHGVAQGPFQIMEKFWGPVPPTFEGQAELAAQIMSKGGSTPEARAKAYYGTGIAPPGHPSPDQYAAQVAARRAKIAGTADDRAMARIPGAGPLLASMNPQADYPSQTGARPMAPEQQQFGGLMNAILEAANPQQEEPQGFWDTLMANPLWHTGAATLAAPGYGGNWMAAAGAGQMAGMGNYEKMRALSEERAGRTQKMRLDSAMTLYKLQQEARQQAYMQQLAQQYPEYAAAINAGFGKDIMQGLLAPKAPEVREFEEGGEKITKQWDQRTGSWQEVARGPRWSPNAGFAITGYDEQGRPLMQMGGAPMGKPAANKIEEQQLNSQERLAGLRTIEQGFKPEYQQLGNQVNAAWQSWREKAGKPNQAELTKLKPYWEWRATAISSLNEEIKRLTGAAMTNAEAKRLMAGMPNPGAGIGDGDSPTEFQAKLGASMKSARLSIIRARLAKQYGLNWQDIPLEQVDDDLLAKYLGERKAELEARGLEPDEAERQAATAIKAEFGL
jgi:hypothetical protein